MLICCFLSLSLFILICPQNNNGRVEVVQNVYHSATRQLVDRRQRRYLSAVRPRFQMSCHPLVCRAPFCNCSHWVCSLHFSCWGQVMNIPSSSTADTHGKANLIMAFAKRCREAASCQRARCAHDAAHPCHRPSLRGND